jgi:hypothetical protein
VSLNLNVPYSAQYATVTREGHERSPPSFGAPTLIWHLAISPHWPEEPIGSGGTLGKLHTHLATEYEGIRRAFYQGVNRFLVALQEGSAYLPRGVQAFDPEAVPPPWEKTQRVLGEPFSVTEPTTIRFTLWWSDAHVKLAGKPRDDALRIRVHAEAHRDFVTIGIFLDAGKVWNGPAFVRGHQPPGDRRSQIFSEVGRVQGICEQRLLASGKAPVDGPLLPEEISVPDASNLMSASRYLYATVWDEFCGAFGIGDLRELLGGDGNGRGRVFANFRGLVMSTRGLDGRDEPFPGSSGAQPFARFEGNGGIDRTSGDSTAAPNESNAVVKAFWPFVRRITPYADLREYIACGVMNWRALYVTALGSPRTFDWREEGEGSAAYIPAKHLPEELFDSAERYDSLSGGDQQNPLRYLFLTKGEPHRQQIGRIVDRINIMGTMRLIALRDWTIIRDASTQIQLRGLELDTIMNKWSVGRSTIHQRYNRLAWLPFFETLRRDARDERLQKLATDVEEDLIYLSAALDRVGSKAVHGLHFRINRSCFYIAEFESLLESLNIGNIDTWLAYDQFVRRGLKPAFDFIGGVGDRLLGLRNRLQSVLEGIETSALVIQTAATRSNTAQLRRLAWGFRMQNILIAIIGLVVTYSSDNETVKKIVADLKSYLFRLFEIIASLLR